MANEYNNKNQTTQQPENDDVHGRTHNSQNPDVDKSAASADINAVDQQEGTMNHGETGVDSFSEKEDGPSGKSTA